jgi:hemoglobin
MIKKLFNGMLSKKPKEYKSHLDIRKTPYEYLQEQGVRDLANRFYDIMETDPKAKELLAIHPLPLDNIRQKFFEFLSGWTGGPSLFEQKYGHPRLRARHLPFTVNQELKEQWMYCMNKALDETVENAIVRDHLHQAFDQMAAHMINC